MGIKEKTYRLVHVEEVTYTYEVKAKSEGEAKDKVNAGEGHLPEFDTYNPISLDVEEV